VSLICSMICSFVMSIEEIFRYFRPQIARLKPIERAYPIL
jgi:hypothetical protein